MSWIIGILTFILVVDCLFLILLILVQLPKKEAGMGTAFGGGATDALFGAGTGNVLTKVTKYSTVVFFVLTMSLSVMNAHQSRTKQSVLEQSLKELSLEEAAPGTNQAPGATATTTATATTAAGTNAAVPAPAPVPAAQSVPLSVEIPPTDAAPVPPAPVPAPDQATETPKPPPDPTPEPPKQEP